MSQSEAVVMAINENYALPAACAVYSIGTASPETEQVIVLGTELPDASVDALVRVAGAVGLSLEVRDVTADLDALGDLPTGLHFSRDTWSRLLIPEKCSDFDICFYMDADMLAIEGLGQLFATDLGDTAIGAVRDTFEPSFDVPAHLLNRQTVDEPSEQKAQRIPYFNSGGILIDCEKAREAEISERAFYFARRHPEYLRYCDQDALNYVLQGNWTQLDPRWNIPPVQDLLQTSMRKTLLAKLAAGEQDRPLDVLRIEREAKILHYLTSIKPWKPDYPKNSQQYNRYQTVMRAVEYIIAA